MPRIIDGLTWYEHGRRVIEDAVTEDNLPNRSVAVTLDGNAVQVRHAETEQLITLTTDSRGETPPLWLAPAEQVSVSTAGSKVYPSTTLEIRSLNDRLVTAENAVDEFRDYIDGGGSAGSGGGIRVFVPPSGGVGSADDAAALAAAADDAVEAGVPLLLPARGSLNVGSAVTLPAGLTLVGNDCTIVGLVETAGYLLSFAADSTLVGRLRVQVAAGDLVHGVAVTGSNCTLGELTVTAPAAGGGSGDITRQAFLVDGVSDLTVGALRCENFDWPVRVQSSHRVTVNGLRVKAYIRGVYVSDSTHVTIDDGLIWDASPGAGASPGHNGVLVESSTPDATTDLVLSNVRVRDSGEHGIRLGGTSRIKRVRVTNSSMVNVGGCGFKALSAAASPHEGITIDGLLVEDAGQTPENAAAVMLQCVRAVQVDGLIVRRSVKAHSAGQGVEIQAATDVVVSQPIIRNTLADGYAVRGVLGDSTNVRLVGGVIETGSGDGIEINYTGRTFRRVSVEGYPQIEVTGGGVSVRVVNETTGAIVGGSWLTWQSVQAAATQVAGLLAGYYCDVRAAFTGDPAFKPGSRWLDNGTGVDRVRSNGAWVEAGPGSGDGGTGGGEELATTRMLPGDGVRFDLVDNELVVSTTSVESYGAIGDGSANDTAAVTSAIADAFITGRAVLWPKGTYLTTATIPNLHAVSHTGPGAIVRSGNTFYPGISTGFNKTNTLHVAPGGTTTNDGLSASQPLALQTALDALRNYGPVLAERWIIRHAAGTYPGGYSLPLIQSRIMIELVGPDVGGPRVAPTAIYSRGAAAVDFGIYAPDRTQVRFADLAFQGYARTAVGSGGIRLGKHTSAQLDNVHTDGCEIGLFVLNLSTYTFKGCNFQNSGYAAIHELFGVIRSSEAYTTADRTVMQGGLFGIKAKEQCTGHANFTEFLDNDIAIHLSRSCTVNFTSAIFKRNGTAAVFSGGSTFVDIDATFGTGADANGVKYRFLGGATNMFRAATENVPSAPYLGMAEKTVGYGRMVNTHTGTLNDTQLVNLGTFLPGDFGGEGAWMRWEAYGEAVLSADCLLRLRAGSGVALVALPAGSFIWKFEGRIWATGDGDTQRFDAILYRSNGNPLFGSGNRTSAFSTATISPGIFATLGATADTIRVNQAQMFTSNL